MAIKVRVGAAAVAAEKREVVTPTIQLELDIRKSMNGDLMIFDHGDIDIILSEKKNKIIAFPKESMNDIVYGAQNRLFSFLMKKGLVIPESIRAGAFFGAIEASMEKPYSESLNTSKMALLNISKFIDEERPYFEFMDAVIGADEEMLTDPDKADSTELGEVPQATSKGSIRKGFVQDPYALNYLYTI